MSRRPSNSKSGTSALNGLVGQSQGRQPGLVYNQGGDLLDDWARTYKKHACKFNFSASGVLTTEVYVIFKVTVRGDGSISVSCGDWISKYSDAIHGNPWQWSEYARKSVDGMLKPLSDVNRIKAGETIYHLPSVPRISGFSFVSSQEISDQQKLERLLRHLQKSRELDKDTLTVIGNILGDIDQTIGNIDKVLTYADFIADFAQWSGRGAAAISTGAELIGAVGVILGFVMIPFQMAELGKRTFNVELDASIAATVAFAFDDPRPFPPEYKVKGINQMYPQDVNEYKQNWNQIVTKTYAHIKATAIRSIEPVIYKPSVEVNRGGVVRSVKQVSIDPELVMKLGLRLIAKNDRSKLERLLQEKYSGK